MHTQLSSNASRRTRQTQQEGGENPVSQGPLAAVQERAGEVIEGALASLRFAAVALQSGLGVARAPRSDIMALTPRALEGAIFPPQHMDIGLTRFGIEELVEMRHNRHG
jgi:hypothetical protein